MTKFFNYGILTLSIVFAFICIEKSVMNEKTSAFCNVMEERGTSRDECYFIVDYILNNTNIITSLEFRVAILSEQDLKAHPTLLWPFLAASIEYKKQLEK